ncbi:hypothetical protein MKZ38_006310 [Zalerion maritima]|uniref:Uncharacterized protein n=1 Tax=Zalerion maritima TaxID=339359 RepID=A0AAD5WPP6_9PEZI|nr:hypothetical protein MKZ38_006310 [Zalerion maritima]
MNLTSFLLVLTAGLFGHAAEDGTAKGYEATGTSFSFTSTIKELESFSMETSTFSRWSANTWLITFSAISDTSSSQPDQPQPTSKSSCPTGPTPSTQLNSPTQPPTISLPVSAIATTTFPPQTSITTVTAPENTVTATKTSKPGQEPTTTPTAVSGSKPLYSTVKSQSLEPWIPTTTTKSHTSTSTVYSTTIYKPSTTAFTTIHVTVDPTARPKFKGRDNTNNSKRRRPTQRLSSDTPTSDSFRPYSSSPFPSNSGTRPTPSAELTILNINPDPPSSASPSTSTSPVDNSFYRNHPAKLAIHPVLVNCDFCPPAPHSGLILHGVPFHLQVVYSLCSAATAATAAAAAAEPQCIEPFYFPCDPVADQECTAGPVFLDFVDGAWVVPGGGAAGAGGGNSAGTTTATATTPVFQHATRPASTSSPLPPTPSQSDGPGGGDDEEAGSGGDSGGSGVPDNIYRGAESSGQKVPSSSRESWHATNLEFDPTTLATSTRRTSTN